MFSSVAPLAQRLEVVSSGLRELNDRSAARVAIVSDECKTVGSKLEQREQAAQHTLSGSAVY